MSTGVRAVGVVVLVAALAGVLGYLRVRPRPPVHPNVLLIVVDTLRADHLGSYGYPRPTSPRLDALARTGVRFTAAHAASSWTAPSVASILTGLYPAVHGVEAATSVLGAGVPTMASAFQAAGYDTVAFSANPAFVSPEMGFGRGFDRFDVVHGPAVGGDQAVKSIPVDAAFTSFVQVATAELMTTTALGWIEARAARDRPFFGYIHYVDPHADYFPPPAYAARFGVAPDAPLAGVAQRSVIRSMRAPENAADLQTLVDLYDAEIAYTDEQIARLVEGADAADTRPLLVVVTADHGEEFGDHGGLLHGITLFEEQLHVPLIVAGHGVAAGRIVDTPVSLVSLWPTLADLTGVARPPESHVSLAPLLRGEAEPEQPTPLFADLERPAPELHHRAVLQGPWKLIVARNQRQALFDLADDPHERHDVGDGEGARRTELATVLRDRDAAAVAARADAAPTTTVLSPERREQLRALGYLQ